MASESADYLIFVILSSCKIDLTEFDPYALHGFYNFRLMIDFCVLCFL